VKKNNPEANAHSHDMYSSPIGRREVRVISFLYLMRP
jgi:hypothetical protein